MPHQVFEQAEFTRLKQDFLTTARNTVGEPIQFEIPDTIDELRTLGILPPGQRFHACETFGEGIRLGEIIIAAGTQSQHTIIDLPESGENENRRRPLFGAKRHDHGQAIALGQHAIHDQHVIAAGERHFEAQLAICRQIGEMAGFAQRPRQITAGISIIFDHKDFHAADRCPDFEEFRTPPGESSVKAAITEKAVSR